jgi:hypothetical protein
VGVAKRGESVAYRKKPEKPKKPEKWEKPEKTEKPAKTCFHAHTLKIL